MLDDALLGIGEQRVETIHGHVNSHALRNPESVAILAAGRPPLTYARLDSQIGLVGRELGLADIRGSDRVAVVLASTVPKPPWRFLQSWPMQLVRR